jgi:4-oxalocrotonate tautomerase
MQAPIDVRKVAMAQKVTVSLEDDLTGGPAEETVRFSFDGTDYEIDLNAKNAAAFGKQFAPYLEHARKAGRAQSRRAGPAAADRQRSGDIRAWAKEHGLAVSERGRIPAGVLEQDHARPAGADTSHQLRPPSAGRQPPPPARRRMPDITDRDIDAGAPTCQTSGRRANASARGLVTRQPQGLLPLDARYGAADQSQSSCFLFRCPPVTRSTAVLPGLNPVGAGSMVTAESSHQRRSQMPFVNVKLIEDVFTPEQKQRIVRDLTEAMVAIEGENMRPVTWVVVEEVHSGDWGIAGNPLTTADVKALAAGVPAG